ncbi:MAG: carbohydrate ABC transporter permease, partial [Tateyamaria sp.]|nr:carbohydrate ABC transporter permease [Tateyamaria sp.]
MSSKAQRQPVAITFLVIGVLAIWMILAAFPFLWTLWGSFKVEGDFFS